MATVEVRRSGEVPALRHSVKLMGPVSAVRWPNVCVSCGATSSDRVPVTRAFDRDWRFAPAARSADYFRIVTVQTIVVPVCATCADRHRQEVRPVGVLRTVLSLVATAWTMPFLVAVLGLVLHVVPHWLGSASALAPATRTPWQAAFFALATAGFAATVWYQSRPRRVTPPTTVTRMFDFSDNLAGILRVEHRVYGIDNDDFAEAFREANRARMWTPSS
jgi:hypothetical protein